MKQTRQQKYFKTISKLNKTIYKSNKPENYYRLKGSAIFKKAAACRDHSKVETVCQASESSTVKTVHILSKNISISNEKNHRRPISSYQY